MLLNYNLIVLQVVIRNILNTGLPFAQLTNNIVEDDKLYGCANPERNLKA
jgi:hypothetical protein